MSDYSSEPVDLVHNPPRRPRLTGPQPEPRRHYGDDNQYDRIGTPCWGDQDYGDE